MAGFSGTIGSNRILSRMAITSQLRWMLQELLDSRPALRRLRPRPHAELDLIDAALKRPGKWTEPHASTVGLTERVVEIPWVLSRYNGEQAVLDVGTSNAYTTYVRHLRALKPKSLRALDLVHVERGIPCDQGDMRSMPYADASFDLVLCVSTLEHVGMDNSVYGAPASEAGGDLAALREVNRVLRAGGRLLVTVPFGLKENLDWFHQYDNAEWTAVVAASGLVETERQTYVYEEGWHPGVPAQGYGANDAPGVVGVLCAELTRARS
jgi:SAM-dependent methyltransferase